VVEIQLAETDRLDWALKQFRRRMIRSGLFKDMRRKRFYEKPSEARKAKEKAAAPTAVPATTAAAVAAATTAAATTPAAVATAAAATAAAAVATAAAAGVTAAGWCVQAHDALRGGALLALHHVELHTLAVYQRLEPAPLDGAVVDKDVAFAVFTGDEAEALFRIEPLHRSRLSGHFSPVRKRC
jgi:small subunit ribosomal protein S21